MKNKIREPDTPRKGSVLFSPAKRLICALLLLVVVVAGVIPMTAWAAWDGSVSVSGGSHHRSKNSRCNFECAPRFFHCHKVFMELPPSALMLQMAEVFAELFPAKNNFAKNLLNF
jgi:hypothetical protein